MRLPSDILPGRRRRALLAASATIIDEALDSLRSEGTLEASSLAWHLPPRFGYRYTEATYRCMFVAVIGLGHQLAGTDHPALRCTADELALNMLMEEADVWLTEVEAGPAGDWGGYIDSVFEDTDFEMLYDPSMDGIEDGDGGVAVYLQPANLHPDDWFKPFRADEPVHPYFDES